MVRSRDPPEEPVVFNEHGSLDQNNDEDDASIELQLPSNGPDGSGDLENPNNDDQPSIGDHPTDEVVPETPKDAKQEKAEKKRLEKEAKEREKLAKAEEKKRKEEEKRQQKEEEKRIKDAAKQEKDAAKGETTKRPKETPSRKLGPPGFLSTKRQKGIIGRVILLDGAEMEVSIDKGALGKVLLNEVCDHLSIEERDYFGFMYTYENGDKYWLNHDRKITDQVRNGQWIFEFGVKFYPPEPKTLLEEITKYQLCLQLRDDILSQRLPCSPVAAAILGSLTVQSELGDYDVNEHGTGTDYLQDLQFCPGQTEDLLVKISELHRSDRCRGRTPIEAETAFLESAKKLDLYGVHLCPAKDSDRFDILVGVSAAGIHVYRDRIKVSRFPWPMVLKMKYYEKDFYVRIRPSEFERYENSVGFRMESHTRAKRFWRLCVEHHTFFRLKEPVDLSRSLFSRFGSTRNMTFTGNTLYQSTRKKIYRSEGDPQFERSFSCRSLASRSFANNSYVEKRRSATLEGRPGRNMADDNWAHGDYATIDDQNQIAVVAGTAHDTSRVAYVKTVRPDVSTGDHRMNADDSNWTNHGRYQNTRDIMSPSADVQQLSLEDQSPQEEKKKKKKKKKRLSQQSNDENAWPTEQQARDYDGEVSAEGRAVIGRRDDVDHDAELSRAIFSVTDMNADLSVNKIEINPSDVARAMTDGNQGPIEIAPGAQPKKTKKKTKREPVPA